MKQKIPDIVQAAEPSPARAKSPRKPTIAAIRAHIAAQGPATVYVRKKYASHFRVPTRDGNLYIVEDPQQRGVLHWTGRDGSYTRMVPNDPMRVCVEVKKVRSRKKGVRRVEQLPTDAQLVSVASSDPLPIRLIKLERVMQITGFGKTFVYEQADFPKPVKLGTAKRAAVRWSEADVIAWVKNLLSNRNDAQGEV